MIEMNFEYNYHVTAKGNSAKIIPLLLLVAAYIAFLLCNFSLRLVFLQYNGFKIYRLHMYLFLFYRTGPTLAILR